MKIKKKTILIIISTIMIIFYPNFKIHKALTKQEIDDQIKDLQKKVSNNSASIEEFNQKIEQAQQKINEISKSIEVIAKNKIDNENKKITLEENLKNILQNNQSSNDFNNSKIELFFGEKNHDQILSRSSTIGQINEYTDESVEKIQKIQSDLKDQEEELTKKSLEQNELTITMNESIKKLISENKANDQTINKISEENKCIISPLAVGCAPKIEYPTPPVENNQDNSQQDITTNNVVSSGILKRPKGYFTQKFGCSDWSGAKNVYPYVNGCYWHNGVDFAQSTYPGSHINALMHGTVVVADNSGAWGNRVIIKHDIDGKKVYTLYAHLSKILVSVGQYVETDSLIGFEGGTPYYAVHLHLSVYEGDYNIYTNAVDPFKYF